MYEEEYQEPMNCQKQEIYSRVIIVKRSSWIKKILEISIKINIIWINKLNNFWLIVQEK